MGHSSLEFPGPRATLKKAEVTHIYVSQEAAQTAKHAVLSQVNSEIRRLTEQDNSSQVFTILEEIKDLIIGYTLENQKTVALKLDVLQQLKSRLETMF